MQGVSVPPHPVALNPTEHIWEEIHEIIFKNCAARSMEEVCDKLVESSPYSNVTQRRSHP
jgi:hypothetical protein